MHGQSRIGEAQLALQRFRSFEFFERVGAAIIIGPTGNNLRDLRILLAEPISDESEVSA
jgi:hydroxypyruvate reductase